MSIDTTSPSATSPTPTSTSSTGSLREWAKADARGLRTAVRWERCRRDLAYFLDSYGVIDSASEVGEGSGTIPFRLWPKQWEVARILRDERLVAILKARQLGLSWLCCGLALWLCLFRPGQTVLLISKGQLEANELLRRIRALYERLPAWMRAECPARVKDNTSLQEWSNGSRVESLPATVGAGRSFTGSLLILDEAAHMMFGAEVYASAKPAIDAGGRLVVLSTANGVGNFFHRIWTRAVAGTSGFRTVFLPWWDRPGRDRAWYDRMVAEADDPGIVPQEYASDPTTCFLVSGRVRFVHDWIVAQSDNVRASLARRQWPGDFARLIPFDDGLDLYCCPVLGRRYLIGADVAEGLERGDYSTAPVLDAETHEEVASLHGRWEPDEFASRLHALGVAYRATLVVERNNHGHAVLSKLRALNAEASRAGRPPVAIADGPDGRPGWPTTPATKPQAIDALATLLRDRRCTVHSRATLDEMQVYRVNPNGTTSAPEGSHDDRVMAWAAAVGWQALAVPRAVESGPNLLEGYRG